MLVVVFGGPAYIAASALQVIVLARAGLNRRGRRLHILIAVVVSLLVAFPLTFFVWWTMKFLPTSFFRFIPRGEFLPFGGMILVPALLAAAITYSLVGWFTLRLGRGNRSSKDLNLEITR